MKKILTLATILLTSSLYAAPTTYTTTTKVTKTVITVKKVNGKTVTSSTTTTTKPAAVVVPKVVATPTKLTTAIDFSNWSPQAIAYCTAMFGPEWMYNPSVAFMAAALVLPKGE